MSRAIILAALVLGGCGHAADAVRVEVQRVNVPVACVDPADVPARPAPLGPRPADARPALDIALAKLVELLGGAGGYVRRSSAVLNGCAKKNARPVD